MTLSALYDPPSVGRDTLAYCTRCKMELAHVIISMVDKKPVRVICKTCKSQHNYKRIGITSGAVSRRPKNSHAPKVSVRLSELWQQKLSNQRGKRTRKYQTELTFLEGDVIDHPKFGVGIVESVKRGGKISVLFRDSERILVHGLSGSQREDSKSFTS